MDQKFKVVFEGRVAGDAPMETAKQNLALILKKTPEEVNRMFAEAPVVVKHCVDRETAEKYENGFKQAGVACTIIEIKKPAAIAGGEVLLTNIESVPGTTIVEHFGLVSGSTIRAKHFGRDIMASLKNIVGGELKGYTQLLQESRDQAVERMVSQARQLGANAVVNVRFSTSSVAQGAAELYAYGTAVKVE
jgi:uncharacterized protein YbjQ (UPF0145 family)